MEWIKKKHVFSASGEYEWMQSHGANPFLIPISATVSRIFFTVRDKLSRSYITYGDFDADFNLISLSPNPVLEPGELGLFDDSGVALGYILNLDGKLNLYYLGWNLKVTVPWLNTLGRAVWSEEENRFIKCGKAPMMDRSEEDPYSISYPSILFEQNRFRMWYGSNLGWGKSETSMKHVFKYAESLDGIHWQRSNRIVVDLMHPGEFALSKPFVLKEEGQAYKMWYSYRANGNVLTYRIGYAESINGIDWIRKDDEAGIDVSKEGWDSEMISYPFVWRQNGELRMLYNGNSYGKSGFGLAVLKG